MADKAREKARADVQRVQSKIERTEGALEAVREERRESFKRARAAGLSLAEIGEVANLHRSRVDQLICRSNRTLQRLRNLMLAGMFRLQMWIPGRQRVARVRMPRFATPHGWALQPRGRMPI